MARLGWARHGKARSAGRNPCFILKEGINMTNYTEARRGQARPGEAWRGKAWRGEARLGRAWQGHTGQQCPVYYE